MVQTKVRFHRIQNCSICVVEKLAGNKLSSDFNAFSADTVFSLGESENTLLISRAFSCLFCFPRCPAVNTRGLQHKATNNKKKETCGASRKSLSHEETISMQSLVTSDNASVKHPQSMTDDQTPSTSKATTKTCLTKGKKSCQPKFQRDSSDEPIDDPSQMCIDESSSDDDWKSYRKKKLEEINEAAKEEAFLTIKSGLRPINKSDLQVDSFVVVNYENEYYPGTTVNVDENGAFVSAMMKSLGNWKWPVNKDVLFYEWNEIAGSINPPKILSKRGIFAVPELQDNFGKMDYFFFKNMHY
ncbi:hypothetical protein J6590_107443 [Homalodisca vitripennis]|nr:hypothetical protein J6590_107443 [Homalodisca vitripennis]